MAKRFFHVSQEKNAKNYGCFWLRNLGCFSVLGVQQSYLFNMVCVSLYLIYSFCTYLMILLNLRVFFLAPSIPKGYVLDYIILCVNIILLFERLWYFLTFIKAFWCLSYVNMKLNWFSTQEWNAFVLLFLNDISLILIRIKCSIYVICD